MAGKPAINLPSWVATQAIEVGADFSFHALVTECAPGGQPAAEVRADWTAAEHGRNKQAARPAPWILGPKTVVGSKKPDPIYGQSVRETWKELASRYKDEQLDVGPMALQDFPNSATAPRPHAPLLLKTHVDAWVQTKPEPVVQPSIDWFFTRNGP